MPNENGKFIPPDVYPPYIAIVRDPSARAKGIRMAVETFWQHQPRKGVLFAGEVHRLSSALEEERHRCEVEGDTLGCVLAADIEHELGMFLLDADRLRARTQQMPTILFELTANGKKKHTSPEKK